MRLPQNMQMQPFIFARAGAKQSVCQGTHSSVVVASKT